jgi:DNA repair exonuclease SbcCD nuclease subunit
MSYSFLAIADVHLGLKLFNLPELEQDMRDNFSRLVDLAIDLKVDYVFVSGDLYEHNRPSPDLIKFVKQQSDKLNANGIIIAGIAGDHDKPINGASWVQLSGIVPVQQISEQFVGLDYCDHSPLLIPKLAEVPYKDKVEWIFLHGHVPELFKFSEEKKLLDIKQLNLLETYPSLKGVILGDIHVPTDSKIHDPTGKRSPLPYIGYCGSLGVTKTDEVGQKTGILYFDGKEIKRHPFKLDRKFVRLYLGDSLEPINWINKFAAFFKAHEGKKPVIIVEYDKTCEEKLSLISPLYEVGIVKKLAIKRRNMEDGETEEKQVINLRSELKTNDRIEKVLKELVPEKEAFDFTHSLLNNLEDPAMVLDELKEKYL